jgi:hypothetical protein
MEVASEPHDAKGTTAGGCHSMVPSLLIRQPTRPPTRQRAGFSGARGGFLRLAYHKFTANQPIAARAITAAKPTGVWRRIAEFTISADQVIA